MRYNSASMFSQRMAKGLIAVLLLGAFGAGLGFYAAHYYKPVPNPAIPGLLWPNPKQLGPFSLTDHTGTAFTLENLNGHWSLLFFGYTNCPDICPLTLAVLNEAYQGLRSDFPDTPLQVIFVSVDPDRDSPQALAQYVAYFNPAFTGLTGDIGTLTRQLGIAYMYAQGSNSGDYLVDHSAAVLLLDPRARLIKIFSAPHHATTIITEFARVKAFIEQSS